MVCVFSRAVVHVVLVLFSQYAESKKAFAMSNNWS